MALKSIIWKVVRWGGALFFASSILSVILLRFLPVYVTPLMFIRTFQQLGSGESVVWHHHWVPLDEISPHLPVAVMASEDQRFLLHHGFDYDAIEKAAKRNMKGGKRKLGASTISQQTAKNVFLWPGRSWVRKGFEVYFTALIEVLWSKQRIMEVYLMVPMPWPNIILGKTHSICRAAIVPRLPPRCPIPFALIVRSPIAMF